MKLKLSVLIAFLSLLVGSGIARAVDQSRTTDFLAAAYPAQVSSATTSAFTLYIGDNLTGVTNPLKSLYFVVSGVYTGGGSLAINIDNDAATAKTFTLPAVSAPTPLEIIYRDDSGKINPSSAGSYSYTLYFTPSGVAISGLAARAEETHQFAQSSCPDGQPMNEKIKSTDFLAAAYPAQVSSATTSAFTLYIGDNLTGVTNPLKSLYFVVSGVYTGGGSLAINIDNDAATAKTFTLPAVSAPTPLEIIYRDDSGKINPSSAGSYSYTLYFTPSGVAISGLAARGNESHRYKPPACGGGYKSYGDLISMIFDTTASTAGPAYNSILWKGALNGGKVRLKIAAADCANGASDYPACSVGSWSYIGGSTCAASEGASDWYEPAADTPAEIGCYSSLNNKRYFRYKIRLCSDDCTASGNNTPQVDDVVVNWSP